MSGHPKRRGQRYIPTVTRLDALDLAARGVSPRDIAERLHVARGTVRCWLSRERARQRRPPASEAELGALADQVEASIAEVKASIADPDPRALLKATRAVTGAVAELLEAEP
jgi:predicted transcriptional regulator